MVLVSHLQDASSSIHSRPQNAENNSRSRNNIKHHAMTAVLRVQHHARFSTHLLLPVVSASALLTAAALPEPRRDTRDQQDAARRAVRNDLLEEMLKTKSQPPLRFC